MVKVRDKWFRVIAISCIWLIAIYSNKLYLQPLSWTLTGRVLLTLISLILTWEGNRFIIFYFRKKYSEHRNPVKRIAFSFIAGILFTWLMLVSTTFINQLVLQGVGSAKMGFPQIWGILFSFSLFLQFA